MSDIKTVAEDVLLEIGGNPANKGFMYIISAMEAIDENPEIQYCTTSLYETIGKRCGATPINVERCIRHEKGEIFANFNIEVLRKYFSQAQGKCTNAKFLAILYLQIYRKRRSEKDAD